MANTIDSTIVAVYNNAADARAAIADLREAGFGSDRVYVSSETGADMIDPGARSHVHHEGGIKGWFKSLFGTDEHEHIGRYQSAMDTGYTIVSVDSEEANVSRVSGILSRYSPADIHAEDIGTAHGIATSNVYDSGYQGSRSDVLNAQDELRAERVTAVNIYPRYNGALSSVDPAYDTDYREHFAATYPVGNYEEYEHAYRYGSQAAANARYQGRHYDDVESELRSEYAGRYPNSSWDEVKNSIRYGWDKATGKPRSMAARQ